MKWFNLILTFSFIVALFSGCKKEDEEEILSSNIGSAPSAINQTFEFEVLIEVGKVSEVIQKTGKTEVAKTTYRYTADTIYETRFSFGSKKSVHNHRVDGELITSTLDTFFGPDTTEYYREIKYAYTDNGLLDVKRINHYKVYPDSVSLTESEYSYFYSNKNLKSIEYKSGFVADTTNCSDNFAYSSFSTDFDMHNLLGINGSKSNYLKKSEAQAVNCSGNGAKGSTQFNYWYEIDSEKRITQIVFDRSFNGNTDVFKEVYTYKIR